MTLSFWAVISDQRSFLELTVKKLILELQLATSVASLSSHFVRQTSIKEKKNLWGELAGIFRFTNAPFWILKSWIWWKIKIRNVFKCEYCAMSKLQQVKHLLVKKVLEHFNYTLSALLILKLERAECQNNLSEINQKSKVKCCMKLIFHHRAKQSLVKFQFKSWQYFWLRIFKNCSHFLYTWLFNAWVTFTFWDKCAKIMCIKFS